MNQTALIIGTHDNDQTNRKQADLFDADYTVVIFSRVYVWNDCLVFYVYPGKPGFCCQISFAVYSMC